MHWTMTTTTWQKVSTTTKARWVTPTITNSPSGTNGFCQVQFVYPPSNWCYLLILSLTVCVCVCRSGCGQLATSCVLNSTLPRSWGRRPMPKQWTWLKTFCHVITPTWRGKAVTCHPPPVFLCLCQLSTCPSAPQVSMEGPARAHQRERPALPVQLWDPGLVSGHCAGGPLWPLGDHQPESHHVIGSAVL